MHLTVHDQRLDQLAAVFRHDQALNALPPASANDTTAMSMLSVTT